MTVSATESLGSRLSPWLNEAYEQLQGAIVQDRLGHAWLIHGKAGTGKINLALYLANVLVNAKKPVGLEPLNAADFVHAMHHRHEPSNLHPDVHWLHPEDDKHTIGIEQVRLVCDAMELKSYASGPKVVIIEPAEAMTNSAANALLKTLEEPRGNALLLLVSHRPGTLPATVRSRCQSLRVRVDPEILKAWLNQDGSAEIATTSMQAPLELAQQLDDEYSNSISQLADELAGVITMDTNLIGVADRWAKLDVDHILAWVSHELQRVIRATFADNDSNGITESASSSLHNIARGMPQRRLIACLDEAEMLRNRLGSGVNVQLALRRLLLGFCPDKESM